MKVKIFSRPWSRELEANWNTKLMSSWRACREAPSSIWILTSSRCGPRAAR